MVSSGSTLVTKSITRNASTRVDSMSLKVFRRLVDCIKPSRSLTMGATRRFSWFISATASSPRSHSCAVGVTAMQTHRIMANAARPTQTWRSTARWRRRCTSPNPLKTMGTGVAPLSPAMTQASAGCPGFSALDCASSACRICFREASTSSTTRRSARPARAW